jgi:hypothetical protein
MRCCFDDMLAGSALYVIDDMLAGSALYVIDDMLAGSALYVICMLLMCVSACCVAHVRA